MQNEQKRLSGKVAIVTGASKGIGAGIAKEMAAAGASVVVNYASSKKGADQVVDEIKKNGGRAIALQADMAKKSEIERLFSEAMRAFGRIDILVNNAGIYEFAALEEITEEHFHKHFNLNVLGLILASQQAAKHFGREGGSIINISSVASFKSPPTTAVYSATKGAVDSVTKVLANELGPRNIRVNAISPGVVITEGVHAAGIVGSDFEKQAVAQTPLGRTGLPSDIAPAAVFLASSDSSWMTGESLVISGGLR
ncbi:MAG TPA: glucose 1-dehydrogenase [Verrucomicrobiae bacterium]|nr:glucose 1-dehydrogenase [Verrucomicrobiae bacterium]